jgi:hypothetical protein
MANAEFEDVPDESEFMVQIFYKDKEIEEIKSKQQNDVF